MKYIIVDTVTKEQAVWRPGFDRVFDSLKEAQNALDSDYYWYSYHIQAVTNGDISFFVEGRDTEYNPIQFEFKGTLDEMREGCREILEWVGGGHLKVYSENGEFIESYEY